MIARALCCCVASLGYLTSAPDLDRLDGLAAPIYRVAVVVTVAPFNVAAVRCGIGLERLTVSLRVSRLVYVGSWVPWALAWPYSNRERLD